MLPAPQLGSLDNSINNWHLNPHFWSKAVNLCHTLDWVYTTHWIGWWWYSGEQKCWCSLQSNHGEDIYYPNSPTEVYILTKWERCSEGKECNSLSLCLSWLLDWPRVLKPAYTTESLAECFTDLKPHPQVSSSGWDEAQASAKWGDCSQRKPHLG